MFASSLKPEKIKNQSDWHVAREGIVCTDRGRLETRFAANGELPTPCRDSHVETLSRSGRRARTPDVAPKPLDGVLGQRQLAYLGSRVLSR